MQQPIIASASGLTKVFAQHIAVDHINFNVYEGECLGVLGPNGAGKTTTMRMLLGHVLPTSGDLHVLGYQLPKQAEQLRSQLGVVPQQDNLDPDFSVLGNLQTYARYFGLKGKNINDHIEHLVDFAALREKRNTKVTELSGGMRRRLILARSLINKPRMLILDEPTTGLDPQARQLIWQRLRQLRNQGVTQVLTTHYLEEAERLCDRILVVDHGKILTEGTTQQLIKRYVETQVFEIHGQDIKQWYDQAKVLKNTRIELVGETAFCYSNDGQALLTNLQSWPQLQYLHRPANLEDVFLKLTGRELRDG